MNAASSSPAGSAVVITAPARIDNGRTGTFAMLLKREYWEHRGGFLWAPLITGAIFIVLVLMGIAIGETAAHRSGADVHMNFNGDDFSKLGSTGQQQGAAVINALAYAPVKWALITFAFVVFFYCLGALFDDRKDRSILFWKSLPVSDGATVLSKVFTATIVAPLIASVIGLVFMLIFMLIGSAEVAYHGGHPFSMIWSVASPIHLAAYVLGAIPVYAAWSLPTIGWLLLVSVWARTKPFLWAVMVPVFAGIIVNWFHLMQLFNLDAGWFWQHAVGRLLLSAVPGSDLVLRNGVTQLLGRMSHGPETFSSLLSLQTAYASFATADMWIGIALGAAMIFAAIRLRRWRDDS